MVAGSIVVVTLPEGRGQELLSYSRSHAGSSLKSRNCKEKLTPVIYCVSSLVFATYLFTFLES